MKLYVIIEKEKGEFWGRIEGGDFLPVSVGNSVSEVLENLKMLLGEYIQMEGQFNETWKDIRVEDIDFDILYDLQAFFEEFNFLNISAIASRVKMNQSLLRQYAKGIKHPSPEQTKRIEKTIHSLAGQMGKVSLISAEVLA